MRAGAGLGQIDLSAFAGPVLEHRASRVLLGGAGDGRGDVEWVGGARGGGRKGTTNLLSALLIMLVRVKLASGSKKGARGGEGGREGTFVRWH